MTQTREERQEEDPEVRGGVGSGREVAEPSLSQTRTSLLVLGDSLFLR